MAFVPVYIFVLFFTIIIDYIAGIMIENSSGTRRKMFLVMSIIGNISVLAFFKYFNFFSSNINSLLLALHISVHTVPLLAIILPIGLSFHTFQAMSYTIEVYRGNQKAERHFGIYSLYVMFYPQLVAGPIERPQNMLHQFHEEHTFSFKNASDGLKLMMWGLFKKVVIADRLAMLTDPVFNHPHDYTAITLLIATFFFTFQIFCDFSGYSDIALGTAQFMGFKLMVNFNRPYHAKDVSEFWKRWHISLSTWFRDYLYISLGGNRVTVPRWYFNLFFVFLISGFWHGANWTFLAWGALHGFYLISAIVLEKINIIPTSFKLKFPGANSLIQLICTFGLVMFSWIFFRANNMHDAFFIIGKIPVALKDVIHFLKNHQMWFGKRDLTVFDEASVFLCFALIVFLEVIHCVQSKRSIINMIAEKPVYVRWAVYYAAILFILFLGVFDRHQFIYFQF
jgi:D-alanyl-lipoteichoic acid acyltransferase DltB (MBOAT superfamily)